MKSTKSDNIPITEKWPPVLEVSVAAGFPSPAEQYEAPSLNLHDLLIRHPAATFCLRATGNSMVGAGIRPGDILVVDRSLEPVNGCIVIAVVDNEFTVKYYKTGDRIRLEAANPVYPPIEFSDGMELKIFGVVTAVVHQFIKKKIVRQ